MNCLLDADALIALTQKDDSNHQLAKKTIKYIEKCKITQVLSPFTAAETVTAMSRKMGHQKAKKALGYYEKDGFGNLGFEKRGNIR